MRTTRLLLLLIVMTTSVVRADECSEKMPSEVVATITERFPGWRPIRVHDYAAEDIDSEKTFHGGDPCLAVERGDFDGNGEQDVVFLMVRDADTRLIVAMQRHSRWTLRVLREFTGEGRGCCYVNVTPPGQYENSGDAGVELAPQERRSFVSTREGVIAGHIESYALAFFRTPKGWIHVRVSD